MADSSSDDESSADNSEVEEEISQELTEKLVHFQEITNIDDLSRCKKILQEHAWSVESAVQSTFLDAGSPAEQITAAEALSDNSGLRHRNVPTISPPLPLRNSSRANLYEARRLVRPNRQEGIIKWGFYVLSLPFRFTWSTLFGIARFIWRIFVPDPRTQVTNPLGDVRDFITEYNELYGTNHPVFYLGTYADAQNESRRQMKFLLVYLHGPEHEDTLEFCSNTLSNSDIKDFIQRHFVFWACSTEKPEGYRVSRSLRNNTHPFLAIICQYQGKMTVVGRLEGPLTPQELKEQTRRVLDRFEPIMVALRTDRAERDMTQQLRNEQDAAYQQSLLQDKEKEKKRIEEGEIKRKEELELREKKRRVEEAEARYQRRKQACKEAMTTEYDSSDPDALKLVIKLPDGSRLTRIFLSSEPVKAIHDFIYSQDNAPRQFLVLTNFPRKIIPGCSTSEVLALEEEEAATTKVKTIEDDSVACNNIDGSGEGKCLSIAEAGLQSSVMLFVQAIDTDDEDSSNER